METSHVYVMRGPTNCKIGRSMFPGWRRKELSTQRGEKLELVYVHPSVPTEFAKRLERRAHERLKKRRIGRSEWFVVKPATAIRAVKMAELDLNEKPDHHKIERCKKYLIKHGWKVLAP